MTGYLEKINSPEDLKDLSIEELEELAREIRDRIVSVLSVNGGHLASSLGAVEITLALHYVFDCPRDKIIWDVGHQAYAHKILTGRNRSFPTLRRSGGISGFPKISESEYDCFGTGHASTAISAALGIATARDMRGEEGKVIAFVGDGSLTGGLCYEALNNAGHRARDLLVVLNDNEMSISPNVGAISEYLSKIISSPIYNRVRSDMQLIVKRIPAIGQKMYETARRLEESIKNLIAPGILFEEMGFRYFGPVDGHNIRDLVTILERLERISQPVILHVLTKKGKGYDPAEQHPEYFHGSSPFDVSSGKPRVENTDRTYTDIFSETIVELAKKDSSIVAITAAMSFGTGLNVLAERFPDRFFDVGIAEEHAVTFAAGLAVNGCKPVVAIYATFLQRAYDQIVHDVCLQNLPVVFAVDRGGVVGPDGPTHSGQFAISYLRHIPNLVVMEPASGDELREMLNLSLSCAKPAAIVYPKGKAGYLKFAERGSPLTLGRGQAIRRGDDITIVALGPMVKVAEEVAEALARSGKYPEIINARFVKPLDERLILESAARTSRLVTLEENCLQGGFGSAVLETLAEKGLGIDTLCIGIGDCYAEQGGRKEVLEKLDLDAESIARRMLKRYWPDAAVSHKQ